MQVVARMLYAAAARAASLAAHLVPAGKSKAAVALRARRGIRRRYADWSRAHRDPGRPLLWMHAPSVGEGLQARPVLNLARSRRPDLQLAYTFFSPSAEEFARTLDVDFRDYLPFDSASDMRAALSALQPRALVFSKLDLWPELGRQAHRAGVKVGMISATLAAGSSRLGGLGPAILRDAYALLDAVGAVDADDADRLIRLGVRPAVIEVTGDTRFDQVSQRADSVDREGALLSNLASDRPTLVAGSTWPSDEAPLFEAFSRVRRTVPDLRLIIAPHEMSGAHLESIERWARAERLTVARVHERNAGSAQVVVVDRFGLLGDLYALATVAFVGGGFHDAGLHSVLEPAAFGAPVLFGPKHVKSRDADLLLATAGAHEVSDAGDVERALAEWLTSADARAAASRGALDLVARNRGAAERSYTIVERLLG